MELETRIGEILVGHLVYDEATALFSFSYKDQWVRGGYPLSPHLDFQQEEVSALHSAAVRAFFGNLLPEGRALDEAAAASKVSKTNEMGLLAVLGKEAAGALRIGTNFSDDATRPDQRRPLPLSELSERIRARASMPFSVWDQRVRLSIAGYQDKIAVLQDDQGDWFFVDGPTLASTHIIKPEPMHELMAGLTSNEFFCMRLARSVGLSVADVELRHIPEPVLVIKRFDRELLNGEVFRFPVIDGCQMLNLPASHKYERPYGDARDVAQIRDGATYARLFKMLDFSARPAPQKFALLRWAIFQILIGNTDAHAKNLTFHTGRTWLFMAPAYDLVCTALYSGLEDTYAMAIGDAFTIGDLSAMQWAEFCAETDMKPALVVREIRNLTGRSRSMIEKIVTDVIVEGGDPGVVGKICEVVLANSAMLEETADHIAFMFKRR